MSEKKEQQSKASLNKTEDSNKSDQEIVRFEKMEKLARENINLFPHNVKKTHSIIDVIEGFSSL